MDSRTIRTRFLEFFARHQHAVVTSSSLVPANDPTLYFTNAGMVQFKDVFVGEQSRPYSRACSSQKCLRVSGKHNDLETVGRTPKHHTLFEMLGNFSFGDYFKEEAITLAWRFLTAEMGLPAERMVATVFCGEEGVPADEQAYATWRDVIGLPVERIFRLGSNDNFWAMGETGPCGPCSEIHLLADPAVSMREALAAGGPAVDGRWVEIWNLVFMQFNRQPGGVLQPLARTGVDTGMGLERLTALVNGFSSTYDTDLLRPLIDTVSRRAGVAYGAAAATDVSMRVIADHARATAFCIADGVFPEKGGREYVLRRIMRRAIRHGKLLGLEQPFFHEVCAAVGELLGEVYPELRERGEVIAKVVRAEETAFRRTLDRGLVQLQHAIEEARAAATPQLPVPFVGDLYASAGFPIDLTRLIAEEAGLDVDEEAAHRWVAETHGAAASKVGEQAIATVHKQLAETHGATEFVGYSAEQAEGTVLALVRDGALVEQVSAGETIELVVDRTPCYGRAGGQVGDSGAAQSAHARLELLDTTKPEGTLIVHHARVLSGSLSRGERVTLVVDGARRQAIRLNHSATHLLHHALREVLGTHVAQKGSEVSPAHLRFDFSHFEATTAAQLREVEARVNAEIRRNVASRTELSSYEQARQAGAMALFGEKYGDQVRVVHIGSASTELCGGTHVERAGDVGLFRIVSEEALALGVRRILALTGEAALALDQRFEDQLRGVARLLKAAPDEVGERTERLLGQLKAQEREIASLKHQLATGGAGSDPLQRVRTVSGVRLLVLRTEAGDPKTLREAGDTLRGRLGEGVVVLGGEHEGKATILVMVSPDLKARVHAGKLVGALAPLVGGRGGGRPDMAQAGGPEVARLDEALARCEELLAALLASPEGDAGTTSASQTP
ncbi:MAG: alanine--tRNA ligase [Proteobacteria bacterium]|nr:alanine--tRNA ligase [Pseudomonadota bacterium]